MLGIGRTPQQVLRAEDNNAKVARASRFRRRPAEDLLIVVIEMQWNEVEEHEHNKSSGGDLQYGSRAAPPHAMRADD